MTNNANALICGETLNCPTSVGTIGPLEPEHCALIQKYGGSGLDIEVVRRCFGSAPNKPDVAYRECSACTWGYELQKVTKPLENQKCGDLYYYECVEKTMAEVQCDFVYIYAESFSNQNGCADGDFEYFYTEEHGYLGPVEHCRTCQSGYKKKTISVDVEGCSNGPYEIDVCTEECSRASDCPGYVTAQGTPVTGKPGLLKQILCKDINEDGAKECTWKYRCDSEEGYYNGMITTNYGPTSCNKCPLYQGKYGEGFIRRSSQDETINGCFISSNATISATEGTIEFDQHCYY